MSRLRPVRGTRDLLPDELRGHDHVTAMARRVAGHFGYLPMAVPVLEFTQVFARTLGDTSDVVTKEMYTFTDRGGDSLTLRPEATAGVVRAMLSGGLAAELPLKFFVAGPMFRHERPQKGRLRQFHQIDVELLGVAEPGGDVEIIALGAEVLRALGLLDSVTLRLNTLGDGDSRRAYRAALVQYFEGHADRLSPDSRRRLNDNPLRILDSKDDGDRRVVAGAPASGQYMNDATTEFFGAVREGLDGLGIAYELDPHLVRGLDYYDHTAFEFVTDALGAQGTVLAGGRYDGLCGLLGGPPVAGVGWAAGVERLAMLCAAPPAPRPFVVVPVGAAGAAAAPRLAHELRQAGLAVDLGFRGNLSRRLRRAARLNARAAVLLGDDELERRQATVRDLDSGAQDTVALDRLVDRLRAFG